MSVTAYEVVSTFNSGLNIYEWWKKKFDPAEEPAISKRESQHLFFGVVEDINDPRKSGRVKVRMFDIHAENTNQQATDDLDWAMVMTPTTSPSVSGIGHSPFLLVGQIVVMIPVQSGITQKFFVIGSLPQISDDGSVKMGFYDRTGQIPRNNSESDINIRSRGLKSGDDISITDNSFAHAPVQYCTSEYLKNHVYETETGHVKEYDDTPGNERITEKHRTGTGYTCWPDGTKTEKVVRDRYTAIIGDDTIEVKGSVTIIASEDVKLISGGNVEVFSEDNIWVSAKNSSMINVGGFLDVEVNDYIRINTNKDALITAKEGITIQTSPLGYCVNRTDSTDVKKEWDSRDTCVLYGDTTYEWKLYDDSQTSNIVIDSYDDLVLKSRTGDVMIESGEGKQIHLNKDTV